MLQANLFLACLVLFGIMQADQLIIEIDNIGNCKIDIPHRVPNSHDVQQKRLISYQQRLPNTQHILRLQIHLNFYKKKNVLSREVKNKQHMAIKNIYQ